MGCEDGAIEAEWEWCESEFVDICRFRGGSFVNGEGGLHAVTFRGFMAYPDSRPVDIGFRVARNAE